MNATRSIPRRRLRPPWLGAVVSLLLALPSPRAAAQSDGASVHDVREFVGQPAWRLFAVEYARSRAVPERRLVRGAPPDARVDMSWYFFVVVGHGRVVLIDAGTDALAAPGRQRLRAQWSIARAVGVEEALGRLGLTPDRVTDIVITHFHWDHVDGLTHFPRATLHVHRDEWARVPARLRGAVDSGRLCSIAGSPHVLWPGFRVREAGRHTGHHLMVELGCASGPVVIAGDAAYLYRNIEARSPVTVTVDGPGNVSDVGRAVAAVGADNVIPGHDPTLFDRYRTDVAEVAAICR